MPTLVLSDMFPTRCMSAQKRRHSTSHAPNPVPPALRVTATATPVKTQAKQPPDNSQPGWQDRKVDRRPVNGGGYRC